MSDTLDLLWATGKKPGGRTKPRLSVERIVSAAVELADADGLGAVSMARVASRLGAATMALYRHTRNKDELVALMLEAAVGLPPTDGAAEGWRAGLERWAHGLLDVVHRHRWALDLPLAQMPLGPRRAAWLDRGLAALADTALLEPEKAMVVLLVNDYVFSHARMDAQFADAPATDAAPFLPSDVDASRYPALHRALGAGVFGKLARDRDADFTFGLARILDGLDRLIAQRRTARVTRD